MRRDTQDSMYQSHMKDVYRYLRFLSLDHHTAEDLVQETFYRAYLYLENCKSDKVKPWLFKVAYHAFIDLKRKNQRNVIKEADYFANMTDGSTIEGQVLKSEHWREIAEAIAVLPENQKHALLLYDFQNLSYQEASEIMGIGLSHFKILLFRARHKLRETNGRKEIE